MNSSSHLISTSLPGAYQDPAQALQVFDITSAILVKGIFLNIAMALGRSDGLNTHGGMQERSKKQGSEGDLPLPAVFCLLRIVRLERKR